MSGSMTDSQTSGSSPLKRSRIPQVKRPTESPPPPPANKKKAASTENRSSESVSMEVQNSTPATENLVASSSTDTSASSDSEINPPLPEKPPTVAVRSVKPVPSKSVRRKDFQIFQTSSTISFLQNFPVYGWILGETLEIERIYILSLQHRLPHRRISRRRKTPETTTIPTETRLPYRTKVHRLPRGKASRTNICEPSRSRMTPALHPTSAEFSRLHTSTILVPWPAAVALWNSERIVLQRKSSHCKLVNAGTQTNGVRKAAKISTMSCRLRA